MSLNKSQMIVVKIALKTMRETHAELIRQSNALVGEGLLLAAAAKKAMAMGVFTAAKNIRRDLGV